MSKVIPTIPPNSTIYRYGKLERNFNEEARAYATQIKCKDVFNEIFSLAILMQLLAKQLYYLIS